MTIPPARAALYDALLSMQTREEIDAFLADLCTPAELRAFAERWEVARLLDAGGK
ncbi:TrpR like protein, YerC/YecD, partial [Escherichia coli]|nr:TrpR like protein, YerC/YecD [Escherichia coli]